MHLKLFQQLFQVTFCWVVQITGEKKTLKCFGKIPFHGDVFKSILNAGLPHPFLFWYQSNREEET